MALYGGLVGSLGLLYANHLEWRRTEEKRRRWTRFLEELARLSPRVTQTLSPEAVLVGALEATRHLLPQAVGLEVRGRRGLVGERTPHSLAIPLNGDTAYLYLQSALEESVPPGFLSLLGERIKQVLRQVEWGTLALTDPLTGLLNRRGLEAELPKLLALARRYQAPISVVMLDIDRFKQVNDTYGHPVGDEVLKHLGRILQASVRREDLAVRYGVAAGKGLRRTHLVDLLQLLTQLGIQGVGHVENLLPGPEAGLGLAVAVQAELHGEGLGLADHRHLVHPSVALGAPHPLGHVGPVVEVDEVGQVDDPVPAQGLPGFPASPHQGQVGAIGLDKGMAGHAGLRGGQARVGRPLYAGMAVAAGKPQPSGVEGMAEGHGLLHGLGAVLKGPHRHPGKHHHQEREHPQNRSPEEGFYP